MIANCVICDKEFFGSSKQKTCSLKCSILNEKETLKKYAKTDKAKEYRKKYKQSDKYKKYSSDYVKNKWKKNKSNKEFLAKRKEEKHESYERHKEEILGKNRKYNEENRNHLLLKKREYYEKNKEYLKLKQKPEYAAMHWMKTNSKKYNLTVNVSLSDIKERMNLFDSCCYCGSKDKLTLEHLIAYKNKGTNDKSNLFGSCFKCNSSKSDTPFVEWYRKQDFYNPEREKKILSLTG